MGQKLCLLLHFFLPLTSFLSQSAQFTKIGAFVWLLPQGAYFGKAPPPQALGYT
jgi:hypothetical protein